MPWKAAVPNTLTVVSSILLVGFPVSKLFSMVVPEAPPGASTVVLIVTTIVGFMTVVVQQAFNAWNIKQNRRSDAEDREAKAIELLQHQKMQIDILDREAKMRQEEIRVQQEDASQQRRSYQDALRILLERNLTATHEGTQAAAVAYKEANQVNQKIVGLQMQALEDKNKADTDVDNQG